MKKFAFFPVFLIMSLVAVSQVPQFIINNNGKVKEPVEMNNSNRSIPPGTLIYSQPYSCPAYSQIASATNFAGSAYVECADDFILTSAENIDIVRWWFAMGDDPLITNWIIRIYDNSNCLPSGLINTYNISAADVNFEQGCGYIYDFWANLEPAFSAQAGVHYWISIQADGNAFDMWTTNGTADGQYFNCMGAVKAPTLGYYEFVPDANPYMFALGADLNYELYSAPAPPPIETPVSNWAIGIGIFLILTIAVLRFRRLT
jgi:hypothetical protein